MLPVWFLPPVIGLYLLVVCFSWLTLALLFLFSLFAFVVLPRGSKRHTCRDCENAENCPWWKVGGPAGPYG